MRISTTSSSYPIIFCPHLHINYPIPKKFIIHKTFIEPSSHHRFIIHLSFTVSYYRYPEKQADGCNLCRSTIFLSESAPTSVPKQAMSMVFRHDAADGNKTGLWFVTQNLNEFDDVDEPEIPIIAVEEKPDGIACLLLINYRIRKTFLSFFIKTFNVTTQTSKHHLRFSKSFIVLIKKFYNMWFKI